MADIVSPEKRSQMMAGIRSANTRIEVVIRKALLPAAIATGFTPDPFPASPILYYPNSAPQSSSMAASGTGHDCPLFKVPGTRTDFWLDKIRANQRRDAKVSEQVAVSGYRQITIWECALRGATSGELEAVMDTLVTWLLSDIQYSQIRGTKYLAHKQSS